MLSPGLLIRDQQVFAPAADSYRFGPDFKDDARNVTLWSREKAPRQLARLLSIRTRPVAPA